MLPGISLRDYFAGQALNGLLADWKGTFPWDKAAKYAYEHADAMLVEREKKMVEPPRQFLEDLEFTDGVLKNGG